MPRIKLNMPHHFQYETHMQVRITDLNYGNHLANNALPGYIHEARVRFLNHLGYSEVDVEGVGIIMGDAAIIYKTQAYYKDTLRIEVTVSDLSRKSCDFYYRITNQDRKIIALAKTAIVFFDYRQNKPASIPEQFKRAVSEA